MITLLARFGEQILLANDELVGPAVFFGICELVQLKSTGTPKKKLGIKIPWFALPIFP
jgi:hypothetical protein